MVEEGVRIRKRKRELMGYSILEKSDNIADIPCINNALRYGNLPFVCAISTYACKSRRTPNLHLSKTRRSVVPRSILDTEFFPVELHNTDRGLLSSRGSSRDLHTRKRWRGKIAEKTFPRFPGTLVILDINWAVSVTELHVNR